jgi:hypothetical protein
MRDLSPAPVPFFMLGDIFCPRVAKTPNLIALYAPRLYAANRGAMEGSAGRTPVSNEIQDGVFAGSDEANRARILFPSTSAATNWARFSIVKRFIMR